MPKPYNLRDRIVGVNQTVPLLDGSLVRYVNLDNAASTPTLTDVLDAINRITAGPFIFSCDGGKNPIGSSYLGDQVKTICTRMEEAGELENGKFTAGTIRATIETRLAAKPYRISFDVLAHLLSHGMGGVQARHYQKYDFLDEKREALEKLERLVKNLPEPVASIFELKTKSA